MSGIGIVDIACGSAHSAVITSSGHVMTFGKGRYGRLGHGDSEDQLRPKLVEALLNYRCVDIACGSGDAQTLCITGMIVLTMYLMTTTLICAILQTMTMFGVLVTEIMENLDEEAPMVARCQ